MSDADEPVCPWCPHSGWVHDARGCATWDFDKGHPCTCRWTRKAK